MLKVLKNTFLRSYLLASNFQNLGANIYNMIFVVYLATTFNSKLLVGLADSIVYLPSILSIWLGFRADKTREKGKWLINFSLLQGLIFLLVAYLVGFKHYGIVIFVAFLNVFSDSISSYLTYLMQPIFKYNIPDEELVTTNSFLQVVSLTVILASQPLGVWLLSVTRNNFPLLALINAAIFFFSALIYWKIRGQLNHNVEFSDIKEPIRVQLKKMYVTTTLVFKKSEGLNFLPMIILLLLNNVLSVSFLTLMNIQFLENPVLDLSYAKSLTMIGVAQILGSLLGGLTINHIFKTLKITHILVIESLLMICIGLSGILQLDSIVILLLAFCQAFMGARFTPIFYTILIRYVPDEQLGQVRAFISFLVTIAIPFGSALFSFLGAYSLLLAWWLFLVLASICIFIVVCYKAA